MKAVMCAIVVASASAFAPASSFAGSSLAVTARAAQGPQMFFNGGVKNKKAPAPVQEAAAKGKKAAASAQSAVKKAGTPLKRGAAAASNAAKSAPAPVKKAGTALKRAAAEVAAPGNPGDFAIEFGSDVEAPFWDPAKLALDKPAETIEWYRAAELKHGRVAMLAALGTFVNALGIALPDSVFQGTTKSFDALAKVADQRPGALIQIVLAIAAVEALSVQLPEGDFPGDLKFDPANQLPQFEKQGKVDELRLKELKNGRLAMIGIAGMWVQEALTGQGVFEQLASGHLSPVADGQGYF